MAPAVPWCASSPRAASRCAPSRGFADTLLEAHAAGRVRATIGRGSDFHGPGATNTVAGQLVFPAVVAGRKAHWVGSLDQPHTLSYIEDFACGLVTLATDERALGGAWHVPAAPPITGRDFIALAFEVAGKPARIGLYPRWMISLAAPFSRDMREIVEVLYQFERPFVLDASRFTSTFGEIGLTDHRTAIRRTLEAMEGR